MYVLISYAYFSDPGLYRALQEAGISVLADSGAFTAWNAGKAIPLAEFAKFAQEVHGHVDGYFTLDEIGDAKQSHENHLELRAQGLKPIPVWQGYDPEFQGIEGFLQGEEYVSIGGLVKNSGVHKEDGFDARRVTQFMRLAGKRRVHLLGYASRKWLGTFQPYSVDSSSLYGPVMFGAPIDMRGPDGRHLGKMGVDTGPETLEQLGWCRKMLPSFDASRWGAGNLSSMVQKRQILILGHTYLSRAVFKASGIRMYGVHCSNRQLKETLLAWVEVGLLEARLANPIIEEYL